MNFDNNKYIFSINSNGEIHSYPELEQMIIDYLDPLVDYKPLILTNKYYHDLITKTQTYSNLKPFCIKQNLLVEEISNKKIKSFILACRYGYLSSVERLLKKYRINIRSHNNYAFRIACEYGHLHVVKYLYALDNNICVSDMGEYAYEAACHNGHLDVVKYLISLNKGIKIDWNYGYAFKAACRNGHLDVAKYLISISKKPNIFRKYIPFILTYREVNSEVVEYLVSL